MSSSGFDDDDDFVPQQPSHFVQGTSSLHAPSGKNLAVTAAVHAKTRTENERGIGVGLYSPIPTSSLCPPPTLLSSSSSSSPASASSLPLPPQQVGSRQQGTQPHQNHQSSRRGEVNVTGPNAFHYHGYTAHTSATNTTTNTTAAAHHVRSGGGGGAVSSFSPTSFSRSPSSPALSGFGHHVTLFRHRRHIRLTSVSATATISLNDTLLSVARTLLIPNTSEGMGKGAGGPSSSTTTSSNNTNSNTTSGGGPSSSSSPSTSVASPAAAAAAAVGDGSGNNALLLSGLPTVPSVLASPFGPIVLTPGPSAACEALMGIPSSSSFSSHPSNKSSREEGANKKKGNDDKKKNNKKGNKSTRRAQQQGAAGNDNDNEKDNSSEDGEEEEEEYDPYAGLYDEDGLPIPQERQHEGDAAKGSSSSAPSGGEQPSLTMPVTMSLPHCSLELYFDVPCDIIVDIEGLSDIREEVDETEVGGGELGGGEAVRGRRTHRHWQKRRRIPSGPLQLMFVVCLNDKRTLNALFSTERKVSVNNPAASLLCGVSPSSAAAALKLAATERGQQQRTSSSASPSLVPQPPPRHHQPYSLQQQSGGGIGGFLSSAASSLSSSAAPTMFGGGSKNNSPSLHPSHHPFSSSSPSSPPPLSIGGGGAPAPSRKPLTMSTIKAAAGAVRWGRLVEYETNQLREEETRRRRRELKKMLREEEANNKKVLPLKSAEAGGDTPPKRSESEKSNNGATPTKADNNKKKESPSSNKRGLAHPTEGDAFGDTDDDDDFDFQTVTMAAPPPSAPFAWYRLGFSCVDPQPEHVSFHSTEQQHHAPSTPPPRVSGMKMLRSQSASTNTCSSSRVGLSDGIVDSDVFFSTHTETTISASTLSIGTRSSSAPIPTRGGLQQRQQLEGSAPRGGPAGYSQKQRKGAQLSFFFKIPNEYADKFSPSSTEHPPLYVDKKGRVVPFVASLVVLADIPLTPSYRYAYYRSSPADQRRALCSGVSGTNGSGSQGKTLFGGSASGEKGEALPNGVSQQNVSSLFRRVFNKEAICNALALLCPRRSETFLRELMMINKCTSSMPPPPPRIRSIHYSVPDFLTAVGGGGGGGGGSSSSASGSLVSSNTLLLIPNFGLILCPSGGFIAFDFSTPQHVIALLGAPQSVLKEIPTAGSYNDILTSKGKGKNKKRQQAPRADSGDEEEGDEGVEGGGGGRGGSQSGGGIKGLPPLSSSCGYIFTYPHLGVDIHFGFPPPAVSTTLASASTLTALLFLGRRDRAEEATLTTAIGSMSDTVRHITVHSPLGSIRRGLKDAALRYQTPFASTCLILDPLLLVSAPKKDTTSTTSAHGGAEEKGTSSVFSSTSTSSSSSSGGDSSTSENEESEMPGTNARDEDHPIAPAYPAVAVTLSTKWPALRDELTMGGRPRLLRVLERKVFETRDTYQNSQQRQQRSHTPNQLRQGQHAHAHTMPQMIHTVALRGALLCFDSKPCAVAGLEHLRVQTPENNNSSRSVGDAVTWERYLAEADTLNTVIIFRSRELFFDDDSQPHVINRRRKKNKTKATSFSSSSISSSSFVSVGEEVRRIVLTNPMSSPHTGFLTGTCRDAVARVLWRAYAGPPHQHSVRIPEKRADSETMSATKGKGSSASNANTNSKVAPLLFQGSGVSIRSRGRGDEREGEGVTRSMSMGSAGSSNPPQHELPTSRHRASISGFDQNHPQHHSHDARDTRGEGSSSSATPPRVDSIDKMDRDRRGTSAVPSRSPTPPATASATPTIAPISPSLPPPIPSKPRTGATSAPSVHVVPSSAQQVTSANNRHHQQQAENNSSQPSSSSAHRRDGCNKTVVKSGRAAGTAQEASPLPQEVVEFFDPFGADLGGKRLSSNNREGGEGGGGGVGHQVDNSVEFCVKKDSNNNDNTNDHWNNVSESVRTTHTAVSANYNNTQQGREQQQQHNNTNNQQQRASSSDWDEVFDNTNRRKISEKEEEDKGPTALNRNAATTYGNGGADPTTSNSREQPTLVVTGGGVGGANLPRTASSWEDLLLTPHHGGGGGDANKSNNTNNRNTKNTDEDDEDSAFYQPSQPPTTSRRFFVREEGAQLVFTSEPVDAYASAASFLPPNPFADFTSAFVGGVGNPSAAQPLAPPPSLLNSERVGTTSGGTEKGNSANPNTLNNNNNNDTNINNSNNNTLISSVREVGVDRSLPPSRSPSRSYTPFSSTSASGVGGATTPSSSETRGESFHPPQPQNAAGLLQTTTQHDQQDFPDNGKSSRSSSGGRNSGQQTQQQSASAPARRKSSLMAAIEMPPETSCSSSNTNTATHANSNSCTAAVSQSSPLISAGLLLGRDNNNNNNNNSTSEDIPDETGGTEGMFSELTTATATGASNSYDYTYDYNSNTDETPLTLSPPRNVGGGEATPTAAMTVARQHKLIRVPTTAYYSPPASSNSFSTAAGAQQQHQQQQQGQHQQPNATKSSVGINSHARGYDEDEGHENEGGTPDGQQHQQQQRRATTLSTASAPRSNHSTSSPSAGAATTATASPSSPVGPLTFDDRSSAEVAHLSHHYPLLYHSNDNITNDGDNDNDGDAAVKRQLQFGRGARDSEETPKFVLSEWGNASRQWAEKGQYEANGDNNGNDADNDGDSDEEKEHATVYDDDEGIQMYTPMSRSPATPYEQRDGKRDDSVARNVPISNSVIAPSAHLRSLYVLVEEKPQQQHKMYGNSKPLMQPSSNNSHLKERSTRNNNNATQRENDDYHDYEGGEERQKVVGVVGERISAFASGADHTNAFSDDDDDDDANNDCFLSFGSSGGPTSKGGEHGNGGLQPLGAGRSAMSALPLANTASNNTNNNNDGTNNSTARKSEGKATANRGHITTTPAPPAPNVAGRSGSFMANSSFFNNTNNSSTAAITTQQHNSSAANSANNRIFYTPQSVAHSHADEGASRSETPENFALPPPSMLDHDESDDSSVVPNKGSKNATTAMRKNTDAGRTSDCSRNGNGLQVGQKSEGILTNTNTTSNKQHVRSSYTNKEGSNNDSQWGAPSSSITTVAASEKASDDCGTDRNFRIIMKELENESTSNTTRSNANKNGTNNNTKNGKDEGGCYGSSSHDHRRAATIIPNTSDSLETEGIAESHEEEVSSSGGAGGGEGREGEGGGTSSFSASASAVASMSASASPSVSVTPKLGPKGLSPSLSPTPSPTPNIGNKGAGGTNNNNSNRGKGKGGGGGGRGGGGRKGRR